LTGGSDTEQREAWLELMLPVDGEAQAFDIERQTATGVGDAKLRNDGLRLHASIFRRLR